MEIEIVEVVEGEVSAVVVRELLGKCGQCGNLMIGANNPLARIVGNRVRVEHHDFYNICTVCVRDNPPFRIECNTCHNKYPVREMALRASIEDLDSGGSDATHLCAVCAKDGDKVLAFFDQRWLVSVEKRDARMDRWEHLFTA